MQEIKILAQAMNVMVAEMGQRRAKGAGNTVGLPDMMAIAGGRIVLLELKRTKAPGQRGGVLSLGQEAFIARAAEHGVHVFVIDCLEDAVPIFNAMRRPRRADAPPGTDRGRAPG